MHNNAFLNMDNMLLQTRPRNTPLPNSRACYLQRA
uniref:Uncharacterized protein n=1 Tax=Arundo donax TaxID=35708 RepID=A0A0A8XXN2_ARUDO